MAAEPDIFSHAQMLGLLLTCAGVLIVGLAGLVVSMIKSFSKVVTAQMKEGFDQMNVRQGVLEEKIDDLRRELDSKIDDVRNSVNELDKRLYVIERDHDRLAQGTVCNNRLNGEGGN